jgi:signal transduction histidine kinase
MPSLFHHVLRRQTLAWLLMLSLLSPRAIASAQGLPFTRYYSWEEVGVAPKDARLCFDRFGRLSLVDSGVYVTFNESRWENHLDRSRVSAALITAIATDRHGDEYFGGRGCWGKVELNTRGDFTPVSLVPEQAPAWVSPAFFETLLFTEEGVYFGSQEGFAHLEYATGRTQLVERPRSSILFKVGTRVFLATRDGPVLRLDPTTHALEPLKGEDPAIATIEHAAALNESLTLLSSTEGKLLVCDGREVRPWSHPELPELDGPVSAIQALPEGGVAIAMLGKGIFLLAPDGHLRLALTPPRFQRIHALACKEAGVLWLTDDQGVAKVLYDEPFSTLGMELGLPADWPVVDSWRGTPVIASGGKLYVCPKARPGFPTQVHLHEFQVREGISCMLVVGDTLLVGNKNGVHALDPRTGFRQILELSDVAGLAVAGDRCYAIARGGIAVFADLAGSWQELAPRAEGLRYTPILHSTAHAVWAEMGPNGVARITLRDGRIQVENIPLPWQNMPWTNLGILGDIVVISASGDRQLFYDDAQARFCELPKVERALRQSPNWIFRLAQDSRGRIWGTSEVGVTLFTPDKDGYQIDSHSFDLLNERYPRVRILPGDDIWITTSKVLHHVERSEGLAQERPAGPVLSSVKELSQGTELLTRLTRGREPLYLPFRHNSLSFEFFSGTYARKRPARLELRSSEDDSWLPVSSGVPMSIHNLSPGRHSLELRDASGAVIKVGEFGILAPWHQTWAAYMLYALCAAGLAYTISRISGRLIRGRNLLLESMVKVRTGELEAAMLKLNDETRYAATLAERNRLAGEIHDSVQQGLSGAMLQLDAMLEMPAVAGVVRSRLDVVRKMISFSRQEVQHAVWDLESPLLEHADLGEAFRRLARLISDGGPEISVSVEGEVRELPQQTSHNLFRIAQEAATNAVKHARASQIRLTLRFLDSEIELEIRDDGLGFRPDNSEDTELGHFGLSGMRMRARRLEGSLRIESLPGQGTRVLTRVPCPPGKASV